MNRSITLLAGTVLACALALPLSAQEAKAPVIVVAGEGLDETPATPAYDQQVIDREQLVSVPSGRIEDALASVAGFQQFRRSDSRSANASAQGATLRALGGNATSRALVLLDGVPMSDPFFGYIPFSAIAPERLSQIRVTRGGGSGPFGAGALAGTIEMESAGIDQLDGFAGQALVNDRGETELSGSAGARLGSGFLVASGRWDRGKGFYTTPEADRVPLSARAAFDGWSAQIRGVAPVSDEIELQVRGLAYRDERTLRFEGADSSIEGQDASLRLVGRGEWEFDALAYLQARNFTNVVVSSTRFVPVLDQRNTPATGLGGKLELRPPVGNAHVLRVGMDFRRAEGELFETAISAFSGNITARRNAGGTNTDLGLFVEDDWSLGRLVLTLGARLDRWTIRDGFYTERDASGELLSTDSFADRAGWDASFRGGVLYRANDVVALRAAAYSGLRLPTLNELYRPFVVFPVVTQANAALENERLEGFEAGIELTPNPAVALSLTAFDNRVKNAVANVTIAENLRQRRNIDAIRSRGLEASVSATLGAFSLDASAVWTDAEAKGSGFAAALDGNRPSQTPRFTGGATLSWTPADDWLLSATVRHVGAQFEDDLESNVLPAATTLDAFVQVPMTPDIALVLRGENLTDETIVTRNQSGSIDLGVPRTVWAGVKVGL
ncbi:TonB-dependent receptor [Qipengyuania flava]|uniref:TonB-dependent receptor n=1 Tax=Qipengyuania flava TaxID=192812 RepID=UPI001C5816B3|nr:TonB-dependent receptor [Qipengyuania flava]MBW3168192.1 TonB-dependent receptor [Qipengyuania flava]MBY5965430.1 TonB-dependent receptor [Qipengyuania flava]MBY6011754.1 TonB-dependent receptor [Qipengyuania flava]MBY6026196.1 TonB-dependent receptor [Qipengyuania flava]